MAEEGDDKAKKLAHEIRSSSQSTEFDLAGYGAEQCERLAAAAFSKPLPLASMVRLSFLVGGGKKVRQKYNDGLPALWADALKKIGFTEDRGASLDASCAGLFKFQHNTDTDLKVTHVYPRIDPEAAAALDGGEASDDALSPAQLLLFSEMPTFQKMIASKTPSLAQRRRALAALKAAREGIAAAEAKLTRLEALTEDEQAQYDTLDAALLDEKVGWLTKAMEAMIDGGQLTASERTAVMAQLASKVEQLEAQIASATAEGKAKRAEKLQAMLADLRVRSSGLESNAHLDTSGWWRAPAPSPAIQQPSSPPPTPPSLACHPPRGPSTIATRRSRSTIAPQARCTLVSDLKPITRRAKFEAEIKAAQKRRAHARARTAAAAAAAAA